mgnify:CR=1 FL=1
MKVCVIDSGCSPNIVLESSCRITQIDCTDSEIGKWHELKHCSDKLGHGTTVISILAKDIIETEIILLQIFKNDYEIDQDKLYDVLQYVEQFISCDLLHMSFGVETCTNITRLNELCINIRKRGTIIVSAYSNDGMISYPAFFDCVIGVDSFHIPFSSHFTYIENSPINIQVNIGAKKVSVGNTYQLFTGSSFSSAYISNLVIKKLQGDPKCNIDMYLRSKSSSIKSDRNIVVNDSKRIKINNVKRAIIFPFNKEVQTILNFSEMLPFEIIGVYDGNHTKHVNSFYSIPENISCSKRIRISAYSSIDWNADFDLIIIGHCGKLSEIEKFDYFKDAYSKAYKKGVTIFSFEQKESGLECFYPYIDYNVGWHHFGKMFYIGTPVLGVFGTSPSQGKMTVQLLLRKNLIDRGYSVGQLGTEPYSELFNFDAVYPFGYMNSLCLNEEEQTILINNSIAKIDAKGCDIIICGSQSGTIPYSPINSCFLTNKQINFALAIQPDASILCVNPYDDLDYIQRTIFFLQSVANNKVLGLILYPVNKQVLWGQEKNRQLSLNEAENCKRSISKHTGLPVYVLSQDELSSLCDQIIDYFSEQT